MNQKSNMHVDGESTSYSTDEVPNKSGKPLAEGMEEGDRPKRTSSRRPRPRLRVGQRVERLARCARSS